MNGRMRKRPLGSTGMQVSELSLGTWGLSGGGYGPVPESEQDAVIERALALGITLFETSDAYAKGEMERRLGRHLPKTEDVVVVTKIGTYLDPKLNRKRFDAPFLKASAEAARERLARERIDVLLLHNPSTQALVKGEATAAMTELVSAGVARSWGVSAGNAEVAAAAVDAGAQVVEIPYNAFHTRVLVRIASEAQHKNVGILARSVLAYGLLTGTWASSKEFPAEDHRSERWTPDELRRRVLHLNALRPSVVGPVTSLRAVALRYALSQPLIASVVIGPRKGVQLDQLIRDAGKDKAYFPEGGREALEARVRSVGAKP
jgi:aryl-alcohol dehydrogenase-like predicted oxidoreductase